MSSTYAGTDTYPTSITIPSDGDAIDAASVNAAFEGLANRTAYLEARRIVNAFHQGDNDNAEALAAWFTASTATYAGGTLTTVAASPSSGSGTAIVMPAVTGDTVDVRMNGLLALTNPGAGARYFYLRVQATQDGVTTDIPGMKYQISVPATTNVVVPFSFGGLIVATFPTITLTISGKISTVGAGELLEALGPYSISALHMRSST